MSKIFAGVFSQGRQVPLSLVLLSLVVCRGGRVANPPRGRRKGGTRCWCCGSRSTTQGGRGKARRLRPAKPNACSSGTKTPTTHLIVQVLPQGRHLARHFPLVPVLPISRPTPGGGGIRGVVVVVAVVAVAVADAGGTVGGGSPRADKVVLLWEVAQNANRVASRQPNKP